MKEKEEQTRLSKFMEKNPIATLGIMIGGFYVFKIIMDWGR